MLSSEEDAAPALAPDSSVAPASVAPTSVVWAVVNYCAADSAREFITDLDATFASSTIKLNLAVGDNSPDTELTPDDLNRAAPNSRTVLAARPDNPGYLPGALAAIDALGVDFPTWVVISNTDLQFDNDVAEWLEIRTHQDQLDTKTCIAPQVYCNDTQSFLNPHIRERPALHSVLTRWALTRTQQGLAVMERRSRSRRLAKPATGAPSEVEHIYACHGTIWIFSGACFESIRSSLEGTPLYAEEITVAETLRRDGIPLVFEPSLRLNHTPHVSTGQSSSTARANRWRRAYSHMVGLRLNRNRRR